MLYYLCCVDLACFRTAVSGSRHDPLPLKQMLRRAFGRASLARSWVGGPHVCAVAADVSQRPARPFVFRTFRPSHVHDGAAGNTLADRYVPGAGGGEIHHIGGEGHHIGSESWPSSGKLDHETGGLRGKVLVVAQDRLLVI